MIRKILIPLLLIIYTSAIVTAKNNVKIATFSVMPPVIDLKTEPKVVLEKMMDFWTEQIAQVLPDKPDLIVLPEACDRPQNFYVDWNIETAFYKERGDKMLNFFADIAKKNSCYVVYSYKHKVDDGSYRNTSLMIDREGKVVGTYNKNFPTIGEMDRGVKAGKDIAIVECDFGRVGMLICFDLLFEEIRDKYAEQRPDLLVFSSRYHGGIMQSIWAYTTQSYFVSSVEDRPGLPSQIYNPMGDLVATTTNYTNFIVKTVNLDYELVHLDYNWDKMYQMKKKYGASVNIHDPGYVGAVLVTSENDTVSATQMLKEFDIKNWDYYYDNSLDYRNTHIKNK
jgi:hypothetical protein